MRLSLNAKLICQIAIAGHTLIAVHYELKYCKFWVKI